MRKKLKNLPPTFEEKSGERISRPFRKKVRGLPLILLFSAIALSPSFVAGKFGGGKIIELRIEDFLIVILGLIWIANFLISGEKKIQKPPLFFPILAWLSIGFLSVLTNWAFGNLAFDRGFFYFLKEVEFFIFYFYIFYHIKNIDSAKFLIKLWIFLGVINIAYVIYQMIIKTRFITALGFRTGESGTAALGEWGVFPTGAFFLMIFVFLLNIFLYYFLNLKISKFKKGILGIVSVSPALGVFGSASKTNFLGLVLALFLTLFFLFLRKRNLKLFFITILILALIVIFFFSGLKSVPAMDRLLPNFSLTYTLINYQKGRVDFFMPLLVEFLEHPSISILGGGIGYVTEGHNQYIRNLVETGIIGSIAFLFLIWVIVKRSFKIYSKTQDTLSLSLTAGLLTATLTMLFLSLATDPFMVVKPASVYWSFAAITMAVLTLQKSKNVISTPPN